MNLSLKQLGQPNFLRRIRGYLEQYSVPAEALELEITETTLMRDPERTIRILNALSGLGVHLSIDDFGTGYSSLSSLQQFPIGTLKIDKSFVRDAAVDSDDATIVATIIDMGRSMNLDVVAEGIETEEQLEFVRSHECTYAQGHLFGDPLDAEGFRELLVAQMEGTNRHQTLFA